MGQHMLTPPDVNFVDKRRAASDDGESHLVGKIIFTANAGGTTTTIVGTTSGADGANAVRVGERCKVFNSDGTVQEETIVTITDVAVGASDTVTFTPALASATASGDTLRQVGNVTGFSSNDALDARLNEIDSTLYSQANLDKMTQNDKVYALRVNDDSTSF